MKLKLSAILCIAGLMVGCDRSSPSSNPPAPPTPPKGSQPPAAHKEGDGHDHSGDKHGDEAGEAHSDHGGSAVELGTVTDGDLTIRASRGAGEVKAGGELHLDIWTTAAEGKTVTAAAVRVWVGSQDAKGSIKSKADKDNAKEPNHWHGDAEAPASLTPDAKLWVEVETDKGTKAVGSFDLKR